MKNELIQGQKISIFSENKSNIKKDDEMSIFRKN